MDWATTRLSPAVLSAEAAGENDTASADTNLEAEPPAPVTADLTTLPFTGSATLGWIASSGLAMLAVGSTMLLVLGLLGDHRRGAHIRRRSMR